MTDFKIASRDAVAKDSGEEEEERVIQFTLGDDVFISSKITSGQIGLIVSSDGTSESLKTIWQVLKAALHDDGYARLRRLVAEGVVSTGLLFGGDELNPDGGILDDLITQSVEDDARPTTPSTGSSQSRTNGGRRSTGRAPGKGSTLSTSPSDAS